MRDSNGGKDPVGCIDEIKGGSSIGPHIAVFVVPGVWDMVL